MGTETEHVFITEFPSKAAARVGKAVLTKDFSLALAFPIVKILEFGLSLVASDGLASAADEPELTDEQVGELLCNAAAADGSEGFAAGLEDAKALPWGLIIRYLLVILGGMIAKPGDDDTADHPPV